MQGSARKDVVFGAARVYTFTVPGPKWKSWLNCTNSTPRVVLCAGQVNLGCRHVSRPNRNVPLVSPVEMSPLKRGDSSSRGLWECGNRTAISKGLGETWETRPLRFDRSRRLLRGFLRFPQSRHFHSPPYSGVACVFGFNGVRHGCFAAGLRGRRSRRGLGSGGGFGPAAPISLNATDRPSKTTRHSPSRAC